MFSFKVLVTSTILIVYIFSFSSSQPKPKGPEPKPKPKGPEPKPQPQPMPKPNPGVPRPRPNCPNLFAIVDNAVKTAIANDSRMGASLLRLHFHDCFVDGCDASVLLDDTPSLRGEKTARPNNNSAQGFDVVDTIKAAVERSCPGAVSCADILAIVARDSVVNLGGPTWEVKLGRRDSRTANFNAANNGAIPFPTTNLSGLITVFQQNGLSQTDLVALSGSHTIGQARCTNFRAHIYNETNIDTSFANQAQGNCPSASGSGDNNLEPLDIQTPTRFDNNYFVNLVNRRGLLHSDQELFNGGSTDSVVQRYNNNPMAFSADFASAMIKMGNINILTGNQGEIRTNCRMVNS